MTRMILMDEFHIRVRVPRDLTESESDAIRSTLDDKRFRADLGRAVRAVFRLSSALQSVRVTVTR